MNVVFYRFVLAMYYYAVKKFQINSITHKYLIRGHTQNEGDVVHSIIEKSMKRAKNSGPIYVPDQILSIIRNSKKKGNPFIVKELNYNDFVDLKLLTNEIGFNCQKNIHGEQIKLSDVKMVRFEKESDTFFYKTSYKDLDWHQAYTTTITNRRVNGTSNNVEKIMRKPAYSSKIPISGNKKRDLQILLSTKMIPQYYESFFNGLF